MKIFHQIKKTCLLLAVFAVSLTACNKLELNPTPNVPPTQETTPTLATLLDAPEFSLLKSVMTTGGVLPALSVPSLRYTLFAPDNDAINASLAPILPPGVTPEMYIASLDAETAKAISQYHLMPQEIPAASIPSSFPNFQYPTLFNPAPSVSALLRLTTFPSVRSNGAWVNNVPIIATNIEAVNGVMHKVLRLVMPPSVDLWSKIVTDPELTYLKAAIYRADSGVAKGGRLVDAISIDSNSSAIASNLTLFAPNDAAMQMFLTGAITLALIKQGLDPATAQAQAAALVAGYGTLLISNPGAISPALAVALSPTNVKGIVAYHILSSQSGTYVPPGIRVFSVNLPKSATNVKTLLNSASVAAAHPGLTVQADFASPAPGISVVEKATVKGLVNATASNIVSMDMHCVNGVIHKIDQTLIPQPL